MPTKSWKNLPQKLLIICPNLLFHSPAQPNPQPKIDFSYHKNVPPTVCSLVCDLCYTVINVNETIWWPIKNTDLLQFEFGGRIIVCQIQLVWLFFKIFCGLLRIHELYDTQLNVFDLKNLSKYQSIHLCPHDFTD